MGFKPYSQSSSSSSDPVLTSLTGGWGIYWQNSIPAIPYQANTPVQLNLNAGSVDERYLPNGVTHLWDNSTGKFDLSELSEGDMLGFKHIFTVTTTTPGQVIQIRFFNTSTNEQVDFVPVGPAGTYSFPMYSEIPVYQNMIDEQPSLQFVSTGSGTVSLDQMYITATRPYRKIEQPDAYVGFSADGTPTEDELSSATKIQTVSNPATQSFSHTRTESTQANAFIAYQNDFDSNQVNDTNGVNAWEKGTIQIGGKTFKLMFNPTKTQEQSVNVNGLVPAAQTQWTPKFNASQYVVNPPINYDDNVRIEIKAYLPESGTTPNMVFLSATNDDQGRSYISRDVSWKFSLRSNYDFGNGVSVAQMPAVPTSGFVNIKAERVDGQISIDVNGLSGTASINASATVEDGWERIGAHIDWLLNGLVGQIHEVKFTNLSQPSPVIVRNLIVVSPTKPNSETVNGLTMVGFPDGDRFEMVKS